MRGRLNGFDWGITTSLVVIPQWLVVIPQREKFKALQSIIKKYVNTTIVAHIKTNMKAGIQASYISHYTRRISLLLTLCLSFASALCNNNEILLVV